MAANVALPPGFLVDQAEKVAPQSAPLPQGFTLDQGAPVAPTQVEGPSLLERARKVYGDRTQNISDLTVGKYEQQQTPYEDAFQIGGQVAGGAMDVVGDAIISGAKAITPEFIKKDISSKGQELLEQPMIKEGLGWLAKGMDAYQGWADANPRAARNLEAVIDVGSVVPATLTTKAATKGTAKAAGDLGQSLEKGAVQQAANTRKEFLEGLIMPKVTPTVATDQAKRTVETGFGGRKVMPTPREAAITETVASVGGVKKGNTIQGNLNVIQDAANKEAEQLKSLLKKNEVLIPKREFYPKLQQVRSNLAENPLIVGDSSKTADKIINKFEMILSNTAGTASGMLEARKKLDKWVKSQKGTNAFDPKNENALSIALREIRQTTNDFIDERAVNVDVKNSLKRQSDLYSAVENIAPKAAKEAPTAIGRLFQKIPLKGDTAKIVGSLATAGTLAGGATLAPGLVPAAVVGAGTGYGAYKGGKALVSPKVRFALSKLLQGTDNVINGTKDKALKEQLTMDKKVLMEILGKESSPGVKTIGEKVGGALKDQRGSIKLGKEDIDVYHGTSPKVSSIILKEGFDPSKSTEGSVWFTTKKSAIEEGDVGAGSKGAILKSRLAKGKFAGRKEYDEYFTDQLIDMGYDGVELKDGDEITYAIFNTNLIKDIMEE